MENLWSQDLKGFPKNVEVAIEIDVRFLLPVAKFLMGEFPHIKKKSNEIK